VALDGRREAVAAPAPPRHVHDGTQQDERERRGREGEDDQFRARPVVADALDVESERVECLVDETVVVPGSRAPVVDAVVDESLPEGMANHRLAVPHTQYFVCLYVKNIGVVDRKRSTVVERVGPVLDDGRGGRCRDLDRQPIRVVGTGTMITGTFRG